MIYKLFYSTFFCGSLAFAQSHMLDINSVSGVFGSGNTGDFSMQFNFAQSTAITYVRNIEPKDLWSHAALEETSSLYESCRPTILEGLLNVAIQWVDHIPDGKDKSAFMQRVGKTVRVSRTEYEKGIKAGLVSAPSIIAFLIHEIGHDCIVDGKQIGDDWDPILNDLGLAIVKAGVTDAMSPLADLAFINSVFSGEEVAFESMSSGTREALSREVIDFVGDQIYLANRDQVLRKFGERPVSASRYYRLYSTSPIPGWNEVQSSLSFYDGLLVTNFIEASLSTKSLSYNSNGKTRPVPRSLRCSRNSSAANKSVSCDLLVQFSSIKGLQALSIKGVKVSFVLDVMGRAQIKRISPLI